MKTKKMIKIVLITIIVALILFITPFYASILCFYIKNGIMWNKEMNKAEIVTVTMKAVIFKVMNTDNSNYLYAMTTEGEPWVYEVKTDLNSYVNCKTGQEVQLYSEHNASIPSIDILEYPTYIHAKKIEILKEESEIEVPDSILHNYYKDWDNIDVKINEINTSKISFTINDSNENPYDYSSDDYTLYIKNNGSYKPLAYSTKKENSKKEDKSSDSCVTKNYRWKNLYKELSNR